ncbi:uncharacterized protein HD556DRAFT_1314540 [Suillus plorans]|uniref:Uncharacterized protein n=1 Tax=Suillus plorans TaxID=116603 RepID=A0A9P7A9V3_9AGAM|nr:uncharacterized protein HD556DRAFT_1314540 [Suillus plorans]KAG1785094.1 hypothetical protein HD556DRAFT_1314540 [Suillus plorans]
MTQSGLHNHRLTTCVLLPNLTAYINDMLEHIIEFIKKNSEIFKIPKFLFEDIELTAQLSKLVSKALSCICSNVKTKHHCLHIFLIGTGNYKTIPLKDIYSPLLLPSLHHDLHVKVGDALGINVGLDNFNQDPIAEGDANQVQENSADGMGSIEGSMNRAEAGDDGPDFDVNHVGDEEEDGLEGNMSGMAETYELDPNDWGFGGHGKCTIFMSTKFWKFVDASLEGVLSSERKRTVPKLLSSTNPVTTQ